MTEEIGRGSHREPSSSALDIVKLRERHIALKQDVGDMRDVIADIKSLLIGHIQNSDNRHAQLLATFNQHNLEDAVVHQKVLQMAEDMKDSRRDPISFWTSVTAALGTAGTVIYMIMHGGNPPPGTGGAP